MEETVRRVKPASKAETWMRAFYNVERALARIEQNIKFVQNWVYFGRKLS